ncbi:MAG: polyphosphate kinase 1, partial [Candidatus Glassbacteria bacterium]
MSASKLKKPAGEITVDDLDRTFIPREIAWLSFNARVLQEARDERTPLIERIKFLGIFSSNLDEFFRVRVATLKRMVKAGKKARALIGEAPEKVLDEVQQIVFHQQNEFESTYQEILKALAEKKIYIINENQLTDDQEDFVKRYFHQTVRPSLFPLMLDNLINIPMLDDHSIYLAVRMQKAPDSRSAKHALIEVPADTISRFLVLPHRGDDTHIILLDDVIRAGLKALFAQFDCTVFEAYTIKLTRDAALDIDDDLTMSFLEKVSKGLKKREKGTPVRFVFDARLPDSLLKVLIKKKIISVTDTLIPGGKYHNFKDFINFPSVGSQQLRYEAFTPAPHEDFFKKKSLLSVIREKDVLLQFPYQSFNHLIDLLREASIDPKVESIKISLYRLAKNSNVVNALINAARNGKAVTVVMELQARFDEQANIYWTDVLRDEGVRILYGVPDLKVHAKLLLITRREDGKLISYCNISTGNFNESTARLYTDHSFCTADKRITGEVEEVFEFFEKNYMTGSYKHLLVSPFHMRKRLLKLIRQEVKNAKKGKPARILIKTNHISDRELVDSLYEASQGGVRIDLILRGVCSVVPGVKGLSENIHAISIIDKFLEHSRIWLFHNLGD